MQVFVTQRKSTPDLQPLVQQLAMSGQDTGIPACIGFDSLKSLPTALPWSAAAPAGEPATSSAPEGSQGRYRSRELRQGTVELLADLLRRQLQLTLFGFDVVSTSTGELTTVVSNQFGKPSSLLLLPGAPWRCSWHVVDMQASQAVLCTAQRLSHNSALKSTTPLGCRRAGRD